MRRIAVQRVAWAIVPVALWAMLGACAAAGPQSTRATADDLDQLTIEIAASLLASDFLANRSPTSPPIRIAIERVTNLSSDLIPESEQWWLMQRIRSSVSLQSLSGDKAIRFVIPAEHLAELRNRGGELVEAAHERDPTHTMSATIRSITRMANGHRTDLYATEYQITDLTTGEPVWTDSFIFKRAAFGRAWD